MLELILGILGSGTIGSIIGVAGGLLNRKVDLQAKQLDIADRANSRAHELQVMDKEREYMLAEAGKKVEVASIEADAKIEEAGYAAMGASYGFAAPTPADGLVYKVSAAVRPVLTVVLVAFSGYVFYQVNTALKTLGVAPSADELIAVWKLCIEWTLFQTGVCVGWWFAMRPGKPFKS